MRNYDVTPFNEFIDRHFVEGNFCGRIPEEKLQMNTKYPVSIEVDPYAEGAFAFFVTRATELWILILSRRP